MTDLLHTAEVRWFFRGDLPPAFKVWFEEGKELESHTRTDSYLMLPGCETVGVKQREGRFEIKALRGETVTEQLSPEVTGRIDEWVKWSHGGAGVELWIQALREEPEGWLQVKKARWLRRFSLDEGQPEKVAPVAVVKDGCDLEVTSVWVRDASWWTFGLEAFGAAENVRNNLRLLAKYFFFGNRPPTRLNSANSFSYPVWLSSVSLAQ